jgi:hypothetical protein
MKIILMVIVVFFLWACQEEHTQDAKLQATSLNAMGDTIIYYRQPDIEFFELPYCEGSYGCGVVDCIDVDCNARKLFATSCSATPYPWRCIKNDTLTVVVVISGVEYPSGTYCSGDSGRSEPVYVGDTKGIPPGSKFDTPPQGWPSATSQGLAIDCNTGKIDIDQSVKYGLFGDPPKKGTERRIRIYYQLNDQSHYTLNYTDITFIYNPPANARVMNGPTGGTIVIVKSC